MVNNYDQNLEREATHTNLRKSMNAAVPKDEGTQGKIHYNKDPFG
jgi:hypothetical protein